MLIESGCKVTNETWGLLKNNKVKCNNQTKQTNKILLAYDGKTPLNIKGSLETAIKTNGKKEIVTISMQSTEGLEIY